MSASAEPIEKEINTGVRPSTPVGARLPSQFQLAVRDIVHGAQAWRVWMMLGWQDIRQRYRRSTLGPFWITISMGAMIGGIGLLYAGMFKTSVADYFPFLALGFIVWGLMS